MGTIKDRNGRELTEADIQKRCQEYTEELYKNNVNDPDNKKDVIIYLEPDILKCDVKWALGSITMNKVSGGDGSPAELFKILKLMLLTCCTQYISKFGKLISDQSTGNAQFSFQSQKGKCQRMFKLPCNCAQFTC